MEPITLYRRAIRSGRVEMMSEVVVILSQLPDTTPLIDSLMARIILLLEDEEHPTPQERMRKCLQIV